ncbi:diacylglycerol/lipid kinase family protein [Pseudokineococcus sp. 1T1Z-3]|uniref:diacylglycerol/lipid kinase family protein n=1 Tax=Pseudokineococcus sp. 1T1Z-3 TaxID=3132745 RepID=UPI0030A51295
MSDPALVCLLTNPASGAGRGQGAADAARHVLKALGVRVFDATGSSASRSLRRAHVAAAGADAVVVVGGDGMAHLGAEVATAHDLPLGIVPAGTGDDVARGLGLPSGDPAASTRRVVAALREGRARSVDVLGVAGGDGAGAPEANGSPADDGERVVLGVVSAGFDAAVNARANSWRWPRGGSRYVLAAARELPAHRPLRYRLVVDGVVEEREAFLVAVANTSSIGGGMQIAPDADPGDGLVDLVTVDALPAREVARVFPRVFSGRHVEHPAVTVRRAREVELSVEAGGGYGPDAPRRATAGRDRRGRPHGPAPAFGDGERLGDLPLRVQVRPGGLRVLS